MKELFLAWVTFLESSDPFLAVFFLSTVRVNFSILAGRIRSFFPVLTLTVLKTIAGERSEDRRIVVRVPPLPEFCGPKNQPSPL